MQLLSQFRFFKINDATLPTTSRLPAKLAGDTISTLTYKAMLTLDGGFSATVYYVELSFREVARGQLKVNDILTDRFSQVSYSPAQAGKTKYNKLEFDALINGLVIPEYVIVQDI